MNCQLTKDSISVSQNLSVLVTVNHLIMYMCCVALLCYLFDLACFFLSSFSSLILMYS